MSVSVLKHNGTSTVLSVSEREWTATVIVEYVSKPSGDIVHHEGVSVLWTSDNSFICVSVSLSPCKEKEVVRNIDSFPYHKYVCAEAWCVVWGKLYANL